MRLLIVALLWKVRNGNVDLLLFTDEWSLVSLNIRSRIGVKHLELVFSYLNAHIIEILRFLHTPYSWWSQLLQLNVAGCLPWHFQIPLRFLVGFRLFLNLQILTNAGAHELCSHLIVWRRALQGWHVGTLADVDCDVVSFGSGLLLLRLDTRHVLGTSNDL